MQNCNDCGLQNTCEKATHIENYRLRSTCNGCVEFRESLSLETKIILARVFREIEECLDNRSCTFHSYNRIEPEHLYEGYLEEDIRNLRHYYLGD